MRLKCNTGNYQCGGRCIRNTWKCKKNNSPEASKIIDSSIKLINKVPNEKERFKNYKFEKNDKGNVIYTTKNGNKVEFIANIKYNNEYETDAKDISFLVNDRYDYKDPLPRSEKLEIALAVKEMWIQEFERSPEGQIFVTEAWAGDSKFKERVNAYKKLGFEMEMGIGAGIKYKNGLISPDKAFKLGLYSEFSYLGLEYIFYSILFNEKY